MKFTKLTSAALTAGTILSILAPTATFAKTAEGDANANGGTELPMTDKTTVGMITVTMVILGIYVYKWFPTY